MNYPVYGHSGMCVGSTNGHGWHPGNHCLILAGFSYVSHLMCITYTCYTRYSETKANIWSLNEDFYNTGRKYYELVVVNLNVFCFQLCDYLNCLVIMHYICFILTKKYSFFWVQLWQ
jgi:hypothetical protein